MSIISKGLRWDDLSKMAQQQIYYCALSKFYGQGIEDLAPIRKQVTEKLKKCVFERDDWGHYNWVYASMVKVSSVWGYDIYETEKNDKKIFYAVTESEEPKPENMNSSNTARTLEEIKAICNYNQRNTCL